jgi:hypothetical protein
MTLPPWLVLVLIGALTIALIYQLLSRRFGWRVLGYWLLVLIGILGAEALAEVLGWNVTRVGDLRLAPDLAGALLVIVVLWFLGI